MNQKLKDALDRVDAWPAAAQAELVEIVQEIEAAFAGREYVLSPEELLALEDADASGIATPEEVAAVFAKFRA